MGVRYSGGGVEWGWSIVGWSKWGWNIVGVEHSGGGV